MTEENKRKKEDSLKMIEGIQKTTEGRKINDEREDQSTEETANKRNTINMKKFATMPATNLKTQSIATIINKKTTSADNKEGRRRITRANTSHLNRSTVTIDPKRRVISLCLFGRRPIGRDK